MKAVEMYYSVTEAAFLLRVCTKTVLGALKARALGDEVVNLGSPARPDYRIPASGLNGYLAARRVFPAPGTPARSPGELRRTVAAATPATD